MFWLCLFGKGREGLARREVGRGDDSRPDTEHVMRVHFDLYILHSETHGHGEGRTPVFLFRARSRARIATSRSTLMACTTSTSILTGRHIVLDHLRD